MWKLLLYTIGTLSVLVISTYATYKFTDLKLTKAKNIIAKQREKLSALETRVAVLEATQKQAEKICEARVKLVQATNKVVNRTSKEIKTKISKGKDYEILASHLHDVDKCGCEFDGTGWVFK